MAVFFLLAYGLFLIPTLEILKEILAHPKSRLLYAETTSKVSQNPWNNRRFSPEPIVFILVLGGLSATYFYLVWNIW